LYHCLGISSSESRTFLISISPSSLSMLDQYQTDEVHRPTAAHI
jgi:hypothetical protein